MWKRLHESTRHLFTNPTADDDYLIYEPVPDWPQIRSTTEIRKDDKIAGLAHVLKDGGQHFVLKIKTQLTALLDSLDGREGQALFGADRGK